MKRRAFLLVWLLPFAFLCGCATESVARLPDVVKLEPGKYGGHLQDVTRDGHFLYWAHTRTILKTDLSGKVLASVRDPDHNAGCQVRDGKLYVAVCTRGGIIRPEDREKYKLQINVYDAVDLHLLEKRVIENASDRAGSLAILPDGSFVVGCLRPPDVRADQVRFYHLSPDFKVLSRHEIGDMPIRLGIEVIKYHRGDLWLFSYGGKTIRLDASTFAEKGRYDGLNGELGAVFDGDGFWRAKCDKEVGAKFNKADNSETVFCSSLVRAPIGVSTLASVPRSPKAELDLTGVFPPNIKCVHLVAPSSLPPKDVVVKATNALVRAGYRVKVSPGVWTYAPDGAQRARYLESAWKDPETDLILCGRGGRGGYDTVTNLDFSVLRSRDVPFVGFSNISCLMNAFVAKGVGRPISGPMCTSMVGYPTTRDSIARLSATVAGKPLEETRLKVLRPATSSVSGKPIGGHWPSISRMDREWLPSTDGRIVFLEVNKTYSLEKAKAMFLALKGKGYFARPAAVVLCDLGISGTEEERKELVRFLVGELSCPVFQGYPYGHVSRCYAIDYDRMAEISSDGVLSWKGSAR